LGAYRGYVELLPFAASY
jgi:hypothetical protein